MGIIWSPSTLNKYKNCPSLIFMPLLSVIILSINTQGIVKNYIIEIILVCLLLLISAILSYNSMALEKYIYLIKKK